MLVFNIFFTDRHTKKCATVTAFSKEDAIEFLLDEYPKAQITDVQAYPYQGVQTVRGVMKNGDII